MSRRAHEETWVAHRYVVEMDGDAGRQLGQFVDDVDDPEWSWCDRDRAELAAAAPEMARFLLKVIDDESSSRADEAKEILTKAGVWPRR